MVVGKSRKGKSSTSLRGIPGVRVQKRDEIIAELTKNSTLLDREVAKNLGVSQNSVKYIRRKVLGIVRATEVRINNKGRIGREKIEGKAQVLRDGVSAFSNEDKKKISAYLESVAVNGSETRREMLEKVKAGDVRKTQELLDRFHCRFVFIRKDNQVENKS